MLSLTTVTRDANQHGASPRDTTTSHKVPGPTAFPMHFLLHPSRLPGLFIRVCVSNIGNVWQCCVTAHIPLSLYKGESVTLTLLVFWWLGGGDSLAGRFFLFWFCVLEAFFFVLIVDFCVVSYYKVCE